MSKPVVFMFSGQGSHYYHMGKELYEAFTPFRNWMNSLDDLAFDVFGKSIVDTIYDKNKTKSDDFSRTIDSSPAIIMIEYALAKALMESGIRPDYLLGASLGETTAAMLAGVVDPYDTLAHLSKRLALFEKYCPKGKMIGILEGPEIFDKSPELHKYSEIAAYCFDSHFVISCNEEYVRQIESYLKEKNVVFLTLPVSYGFHSSMLDSVESFYKDIVQNTNYKQPEIPLISCTYAKEIHSLDNNYFWDVFREPIQIQKTIQTMEEKQDYIYIDLGPSGTLANYVRYNLTRESQSSIFPILTPFGHDLSNLKKVREFFSN